MNSQLGLRVICTRDHNLGLESQTIDGGPKLTFTKLYTIRKGTLGTAYQEPDRITVEFDEPLTAENESEAPYESRMYRTFLYSELNNSNWDIAATVRHESLVH